MKAPEYYGESPCDQTTYKISRLRVKSLKAIGVNGSNEPIKTFLKDGTWHIETPIFTVNPDHLEFIITL